MHSQLCYYSWRVRTSSTMSCHSFSTVRCNRCRHCFSNRPARSARTAQYFWQSKARHQPRMTTAMAARFLLPRHAARSACRVCHPAIAWPSSLPRITDLRHTHGKYLSRVIYRMRGWSVKFSLGRRVHGSLRSVMPRLWCWRSVSRLQADLA